MATFGSPERIRRNIALESRVDAGTVTVNPKSAAHVSEVVSANLGGAMILGMMARTVTTREGGDDSFIDTPGAYWYSMGLGLRHRVMVPNICTVTQLAPQEPRPSTDAHNALIYRRTRHEEPSLETDLVWAGDEALAQGVRAGLRTLVSGESKATNRRISELLGDSSKIDEIAAAAYGALRQYPEAGTPLGDVWQATYRVGHLAAGASAAASALLDVPAPGIELYPAVIGFNADLLAEGHEHFLVSRAPIDLLAEGSIVDVFSEAQAEIPGWPLIP